MSIIEFFPNESLNLVILPNLGLQEEDLSVDQSW
jgi:hypothetical protein